MLLTAYDDMIVTVLHSSCVHGCVHACKNEHKVDSHELSAQDGSASNSLHIREPGMKSL